MLNTLIRIVQNKTQYFRLRLYWLLLEVLTDCSLSALWVLSECTLSAHWVLTYAWLIALRFEPEWWRLTALDKLEPDKWTNGRTSAFLELLSERKISGDSWYIVVSVSENIRYSLSFLSAMSLFARLQVTFNLQKILWPLNMFEILIWHCVKCHIRSQ